MVSLLVLLVFTLSFNLVVAEDSLNKTMKGYKWLASYVRESGWGNIEENVFAVLALRDYVPELADEGLRVLVSRGNAGKCWPRVCDVKSTAQALIALNDLSNGTEDNEDIEKVIEWLANKSVVTQREGDWLLQLETSESGTCTIKYGDVEDSVIHNLDKTLEIEGSACFDLTDSGYRLKIEEECLEKVFNVECETTAGDSIINLIYRKDQKLILFPEFVNGPARIKIANKCFPEKAGFSTCNYEATEWASYALDLVGVEADSRVYLDENSENNKPLSYAFLYLITGNAKYASELVGLQESNYWNTGQRYVKTALAVSSLGGHAEGSENVDNAKDWLLSEQNEDGSWGIYKLRDTAAVLAFAFPATYTEEDVAEEEPEEPEEPAATCYTEGYSCCTSCAANYSELDYPCTVGVCCEECSEGDEEDFFCEDYGFACCDECVGDGLAEYECFDSSKICCDSCKVTFGCEIVDDCSRSECDGASIGGVVCEPYGEVSCSDGDDNDADYLTDCDDRDCCSSSICEGVGACGIVDECETDYECGSGKVCVNGRCQSSTGPGSDEGVCSDIGYECCKECTDDAYYEYDYECEEGYCCSECKKSLWWLWLLIVLLVVGIIAAAIILIKPKPRAQKSLFGMPPTKSSASPRKSTPSRQLLFPSLSKKPQGFSPRVSRAAPRGSVRPQVGGARPGQRPLFQAFQPSQVRPTARTTAGKRGPKAGAKRTPAKTAKARTASKLSPLQRALQEIEKISKQRVPRRAKAVPVSAAKPARRASRRKAAGRGRRTAAGRKK